MMKRNNKRFNGVLTLAILVISFFFASGCSKEKENEIVFSESLMIPSQLLEEPIKGGVANNTYTNLCVPTQAVKIGEDYFIVDCYHNQILYSQDIDTPMDQWKVLTNQMNRGHSIASDGTVYLVDDTDNHRVLIFEKIDGEFYQTQVYEGVGQRPHFVAYDEDEERFYVLSSTTGELYVFLRDKESTRVYLDKILSVPELNGIYVRSFTIEDEGIYFVACDGHIYLTRKGDLKILDSWTIPAEIAGTIQLTQIQDYYYLTVSTDIYGDASCATFLRAESLDDFESGNWEVIYDLFYECGTMYYISTFDDHYYITKHHNAPEQALWEFDVVDNEITNIRIVQP